MELTQRAKLIPHPPSLDLRIHGFAGRGGSSYHDQGNTTPTSHLPTPITTPTTGFVFCVSFAPTPTHPGTHTNPTTHTRTKPAQIVVALALAPTALWFPNVATHGVTKFLDMFQAEFEANLPTEKVSCVFWEGGQGGREWVCGGGRVRCHCFSL